MPNHTFHNTGEDYSGFVAACKWLKRQGYSYGFMERSNPIGIIKGNWLIQKWSKMSAKNKAILDGVIEFPFGSPRTEKAIVRIYDRP